MLGANATPILATTWMPVAISRGVRRPILSLHGPINSCPMAKPIDVAVRVSCTAASDAEKSRATLGNAGR